MVTFPEDDSKARSAHPLVNTPEGRRAHRHGTLLHVTGLALFVVALLAPFAAVFIGWVLVRRRRHQAVGECLGVAAALAAMFLVTSVLAIAGWALPDALDRLPADEREAVGPAVAGSTRCGLLPFARVVEIEVVQDPSGRSVLRYSCGLTHFGLLRLSKESRCADRQWTGSGGSSAGRC